MISLYDSWKKWISIAHTLLSAKTIKSEMGCRGITRNPETESLNENYVHTV